MDPNASLTRIRELVALLAGDIPEKGPDRYEVGDELGDLVGGLDEWLSKGGFLPEAWKPRPAQEPTPTPEFEITSAGVLRGGKVEIVWNASPGLRAFLAEEWANQDAMIREANVKGRDLPPEPTLGSALDSLRQMPDEILAEITGGAGEQVRTELERLVQEWGPQAEFPRSTTTVSSDLLARAESGDEDAAHSLVHRLRDRFDWAGTYFCRTDVEDAVRDALLEREEEKTEARVSELTDKVMGSRYYRKLGDRFAERGNETIADTVQMAILASDLS